jgi:hypothetical protein
VIRTQGLLLTAVFAAAIVVRLVSLPSPPFFCDVPANMTAVETGVMHIQFPGYVPFHLAVALFAKIFDSVPTGIVFYSLICGVGAMLYCLLFAYDRAGFPGALVALTVAGLSPITIYFSCMGASYTTDLLSMSAMIYHGNRFLAKSNDRDFRLVALWYIFGSLMRSLSFPFAGLAVLYLLTKRPSRVNILFTSVVFAVGAILYGVLTFHFYGSWHMLVDSMAVPEATMEHAVTLSWFAGNELRNFLFVAWSLNVYLLVILMVLWWNRATLNLPLAGYFLLLTVPYALYLLWYAPHAGYICMLLPAFICAPWIAGNPTWLNSRAILVSVIFAIAALLQFFVARPIPFTGKVSLVLNAYVLTYTRRGIALGMFDNLKNWARRIHPDTGKGDQVPWF